jgi:flagellar M-ring protein FliF
MINALAFIVVAFLVTWFGLKPMVRAVTAPAVPALPVPSFEEAQRALPTPDPALAAIAADPAAAGTLPGARPAGVPLDDIRQKIKPAPQERLARMVDLNEERSAQILRKWAAAEAA